MTDPVESAPDIIKPLETIKDTAVSAPIGIAGLALTLAMKYHDINTIQDGQLYQQYKLEGRNLQPLHLDHVFETAIRIEMHLLASEKRITELVVSALEAAVEQEEAAAQEAAPEDKPETGA